MAFHNANYTIHPMSGTENLAALGFNGLSATTVHEVFCLADGDIDITALGGGTATFTLTAGQSVKVLVAAYTINAGSFAGFRSKGNLPPGYDGRQSKFAS